MPDEKHSIPRQQASIPLAAASRGMSSSAAAAMLGAVQPRAARGGWQPPAPAELQRDFPQYEIVAMIGRGGMGAVFSAWQRSLDRLVAIKILPPDIEDGLGNFAQRFKQEAKAMAQFHHPGIVAVYDAGETPAGLLYFIMEFIEGTNVQQLLAAQGRLPVEQALGIAAHVCDALACAHRHGVVHRDIKPANIMVDTEGQVKVADFGLAKVAARESGLLTMTSVTVGTPDFMAPESLVPGVQVDGRADLYAVGVMLYQMLTGQLPRGRFVAPSRAVPRLDRTLDVIVDRTLQPERDARYASAIELRAALEPVLARAVAKSHRTLVVSGARPRRSRLLLALAVIVAVGVALWFAFGGKGARPSSPALQRVEATTPGAGADGLKPWTTLRSATKDQPFINTLGMKFVPVRGTDVLFCFWETRVRDYAEYATAVAVNQAWTRQQMGGMPVGREPDHPVCAVNWEDANGFCQWLTEKETAAGKLPKGVKYRLPTDEEWSHAVGLPKEPGSTPKERADNKRGDYPWGDEYPPKGKAGNFGDTTFHEKLNAPGQMFREIHRRFCDDRAGGQLRSESVWDL